ncbi:NAD(P)/FAD-dependent oxidoreductase [Pigmentiphaga litoralis]|uniref:Thioredoxin reductase n=1 Tax=Pigmentiphaga litoralis TaxID=516702 RepID=A0A7Y9IS77_9BURK|nr:NAD(P)/FAD-dependent oxidoreductase [Pigmentiphaga litoralis]NYE24778.1 thioredoxin reductase [Pigmentiphaga litoralis]NYE81608.1 thioredoxin reductase [Pigmentiphaga litoralis]
MSPQHFDVIVVGGSYAGLSAAMPLARARRSILMIDAGQRRNRTVERAHGFLGHDGKGPAAIAALGREQLLAYPNVQWRDAFAETVRRDGDRFVVTCNDGVPVSSDRLVLATGLIDDLPDIPGLSERWGKTVFNCPYCDGYELDRGPVGLLGTGALSVHESMMLTDWGTVTLFTNGCVALDADQAAQLQARGVDVVDGIVASIDEQATIVMDDARRQVLRGLFVAPRQRMTSTLPQQLGCTLEEGPFGSFIRTDACKATDVPGVFACGDAARATHSLASAVGDGFQAGVAVHQSLVFA